MADIEPIKRADLGRAKKLFEHFAGRASGCSDPECEVCKEYRQVRDEFLEILKEIESRCALLTGALQGVIEERKDPAVAIAVAEFGLTRDDDYRAGRVLREFWAWYREQEESNG